MSEITWQPSIMHPDRVHATEKPGAALCDAELGREPVRCALCILIAHGSETTSPSDLRQRLEAECADDDEPLPHRLNVLISDDIDTDPDRQHEAARALDSIQQALVNTYVETEHAVRALALSPGSARATRAREHLLETLVTLNEGLRGHDYAEQTLRHGPR